MKVKKIFVWISDCLNSLIYDSYIFKHPFFYLAALIEYQNILMQADKLYSDLQQEVNQLRAEKEEAEQSHRIGFSLVKDELAALRAKLEAAETGAIRYTTSDQ